MLADIFFQNIYHKDFHSNEQLFKHFPKISNDLIHSKDSKGFSTFSLYVDNFVDNPHTLSLFDDRGINVDEKIAGKFLIDRALENENFLLVSLLIGLGSKINIENNLFKILLKYLQAENLAKIKEIKKYLNTHFTQFLNAKGNSPNSLIEEILESKNFEFIYTSLYQLDFSQFKTFRI